MYESSYFIYFIFYFSLNRLSFSWHKGGSMTTFTTNDAAKMFGLSVRGVQRLALVWGRGKKFGRSIMLDEDDIEFLKTRIRQHGRPKINKNKG